MNSFDVIVIGGGAAGMMAAGRAAECGRSVALLDQNRELGKKLNLTGGGRCNITNAEFDTRTLLSFFGDAGKFLFSTFSRFGVQDTFDFFEARGLPLKVENYKRAFPQSEQATDVTRVLTDYIRENNVDVRLGVTGLHMVQHEGKLTGVQTSAGLLQAKSFILATGGASYQATGSTGDGLDWLADLGHTVQPATPDVVPLRVKDPWVKALAGTTLDPMQITFAASTGEQVKRTGRLLFTHFGLSGPLILNSALAVKQLLKSGPVATSIDLFPSDNPAQLDQRLLDTFREHANKLLRNTIKRLVPAGMSNTILNLLPPEMLNKPINSVTQPERKELLTLLKGMPLTVTGTMGYDWAVVCDGGVDLTEVDTRTLQSRKIPNLYIVGDLLHINRPSGGYSLQLCWSTGWVAGENA